MIFLLRLCGIFLNHISTLGELRSTLCKLRPEVFHNVSFSIQIQNLYCINNRHKDFEFELKRKRRGTLNVR